MKVCVRDVSLKYTCSTEPSSSVTVIGVPSADARGEYSRDASRETESGEADGPPRMLAAMDGKATPYKPGAYHINNKRLVQ